MRSEFSRRPTRRSRRARQRAHRYLPLNVELEERLFRITAAPHIYINKKAVDFAAQELARELARPSATKVDDRILYLEAGQNFAHVMQTHLDRWCRDLALAPPLDLSQSQLQRAQRSQIAFTNALHFSAFDKSDEAMLNDYEELMGQLSTGEPVAMDFRDIVLSFLSKDPQSFEKLIEKEWSDTPLGNRLVFASPVPLNEEQRKILQALRRPDCRFVAIEGPPGCGKSHTIVAIVFEAILTGKNVLVLSDKKEALDVVEDIERQKVLESYGYRFLRINRFNLGKDPVRTLDERLLRIAADFVQASKPHPFVERTREQTNALANGEVRQCPVCNKIQPLAEFRDPVLSRGYGRKCRTCKTAGRRKHRN